MKSKEILLVVFTIWLFSTQAFAADKFVGRGGKDFNDGLTYQTRWRTLTHAFLSLEPGDTLRIQPGSYTISNQGYDDGIFYFRGPGFEPFVGDENQYTTVRAETPGTVIIRGNLDIRGSYIRIEGLEFRGSIRNNAPGIGVYNSHHIDIIDNDILRAGGGGILFNHSDSIRINRNFVAKNTSRNIDQHSGISIYQPIAYPDPENRIWNIEIKNNYSWDNRNRVIGGSGITDGNGIVLDDYKYEQTEFLTDSHRELIGDAAFYPRKTLVEGNVCNYNGGSGIHLLLAVNASIKNNTCVGNRRFVFFPGGRFFNLGQISLVASDDCTVLNNVLQATYVAYADEYGFAPYAASDALGVGNVWEKNLLHTTVPGSVLTNPEFIGTDTLVASPRFVDRQSLDWRARAGRGLGRTWGDGHIYTDFTGNMIEEGDATDLGAFQN